MRDRGCDVIQRPTTSNQQQKQKMGATKSCEIKDVDAVTRQMNIIKDLMYPGTKPLRTIPKTDKESFKEYLERLRNDNTIRPPFDKNLSYDENFKIQLRENVVLDYGQVGIPSESFQIAIYDTMFNRAVHKYQDVYSVILPTFYYQEAMIFEGPVPEYIIVSTVVEKIPTKGAKYICFEGLLNSFTDIGFSENCNVTILNVNVGQPSATVPKTPNLKVWYYDGPKSRDGMSLKDQINRYALKRGIVPSWLARNISCEAAAFSYEDV